MDNARIHKTERTRELIEASALPPFHPTTIRLNTILHIKQEYNAIYH